MGLPVREQAKYWGAAAAVFLLALWFLGGVMLPFLLGGAIAYFLDPVADRLERLGLNRAGATVIITVIAVLAFILIALLVIPTLIQQLLAPHRRSSISCSTSSRPGSRRCSTSRASCTRR